MRKLLVKLVAIETALVGWLGYWIFLVYSNNPLVSGGLATQLSRFPQISFTTVDITVLVLIGSLSIILAFKFDRGLKPGIRLERALQMLESLMKRNLMLEAQIAEMKMASVQGTGFDRQTSSEPPLGSWERAFRTPIEAGPSAGSNIIGRPTRSSSLEAPSVEAASTRYRSTRTDPKQPQAAIPSPNQRARNLQDDTTIPGDETIPETRQTRDTNSPNVWAGVNETSTKSESGASSLGTGRKPVAIAQPGSRRQPYIPIPAPRAAVPSAPPSPSVSPTSRKGTSRMSTSTPPVGSIQTDDRNSSLPPSSYQLGESESTSSGVDEETTKSVLPADYKHEQDETIGDEDVRSTSRTNSKSSGSSKRRFPWEDP
jgi:hypothetical protein